MTDPKYLKWILKKVGCDAGDLKKYSKLFRILYEMEFYYLIPMDENRALDGIKLRRQYDLDHKTTLYSSEEPCSVLEMLIALAIRMENDILGDPEDEHPEYWFWQFLDNLGILGYFDDVFGPSAAQDIEKKVQKFCDREYNYDGKGGIFPQKVAKNDQRKIEIWYQMQEYCQ